MKRVFVGIDLPDDIKNNIYVIAKKLNMLNGRLINPENLHLTLKFIGRATEEQIIFLKNDMEQICKEIKSFTIRFGEIGAFTSSKKAMVVWIGLSEGQKQLKYLAQKTEYIAHGLGFKEENRFHPHVTFMRFKKPQNISDFIEPARKLFKKIAAHRISVDKIVLFESKLKSTGAEYSALYEFLIG